MSFTNYFSLQIVQADKFIFLVTLITLLEPTKSTNYYDFLENPIQGCAILGYPKATLNECGYCVGNGTGLNEDYGKDCLGICHGSAIVDCKNVCNGSAYRDECSGQCLDESSGQSESARDCRGECIAPNLSSAQLPYRLDDCGYCRLLVSESTASSYADCSKQCHPPGLSTSRSVCGHCIGPTSNLTEEDVKDECGNCLQDKAYCSCSRDPKLCGCDNVDVCYKIRSIEPKLIEKESENQILLIGYFQPVTSDLDCVYRHESSDEDAYSPIFFIPNNKTSVYCSIYPLIEGIYTIGLRSRSGNLNLPDSPSNKVFAFDKIKARITGMQPLEILTTQFTEDIELTFDGPSLSTIPNLNLICLVGKSDSDERDSNEVYESESSLIVTGTKPYSCKLPKHLASSSNSLLITPTIDGIHPLSSPFTFTLISPAPTISHANCFISSDGLAMVIMFSRPIDVFSSQEMNSIGSHLCDHILAEESSDKLSKYKRLYCVWSSKVQLVIYLQKPMEENVFELILRKGIFKEDSANIALVNDEPIKIILRKLTTEWWVYTPRLVITGPSEVPRCGLFSLSGHYSSPKGTTGLTFKWSVTRDNKGSSLDSDDSISEELAHLISTTSSQNLALDAVLFEPGVGYQFTLTAEAEDGIGSLTATHRLIRFNYDAPIVSIYSNIMLPAEPYSVDTTAIFWAEAYIPTCVNPFQRVGLFWKVADPQVKFNFTLTYLSVYILSPFSLPPNHPVTFYLSAFLGHRINETSGAAFSLVGQQSPLRALISGGSPMMAFGHQSGPITISGLSSGDGTKKPITYHWNCLDSDTHEPCFFNFASLPDNDLETVSSRNYLLINQSMQKESSLTLDSSNFLPNKELILSLQVYDRNDTSRVSDPELALIKITEGDAPQVTIGSIYIRRKYRANLRSPHNLAIMVPAHNPLLIKGTVKSSGPLSYLGWEANNFIHPLNWNTRRGANGEIQTELHIHSDHIYPYGLHVFKLKACNPNNQCSEASTQFTASQGVTQCSITVPAYYEYELVTISVEKCNIPPGYGPLVYQLYGINDETEELFPITVPQFSNVFIFPGLPAIDSEHTENTFALKFCDIFNYCDFVFANPTIVYPNENKTSLIADLLKLAQKYNIGGDPFHALESVGVILKEPNLDNSIMHKAMTDAIEYNLGVLQRPSQLLNRGQISLSFGILSEFIKKSENNLQRQRAMDSIRRLAEKAYSLEMLPDLMAIRSTLFNLMFPYSRGNELIVEANDLPKTLKSSRQAFNVLLQMAAAQLPLGKRVEFGTYNEYPIDEDGEADKQERIFKTIMVHDKKIEGTHLKIGDIEATIKIGTSIKKRFSGPWRCSETKSNSLCNSVVYSYTIFPVSGPFPEVSDGHRIAPILVLNVFAPGSGRLQTIKGGLNAVEMTFTYTGNRTYGQDYLTKCKSWSDSKDSWRPDGVHLLRISPERISCWSGFIAPFTIYRVPQRWNVSAVVSMVLGGLLFFIIVSFTMIICSKSSSSIRSSSQRLVADPRRDQINESRMLRPMTE
ncbi:uncharacterized protein LOC128397018 [Panonychus citri]|uniref:uncharacterized protein LOC128397018 n=1 Tax=Panonychus citri TaxID=50023 RepID=UPI0023073A6F|nr:uncharacterized protein LOC128397018 [Panonychus citri]